MLRTLDKAYFRLKDAWTVLRGEDAILKAYTDGVTEGVEIANARILQRLSSTDPHQFESQHFKLGYYYASETVKKVMSLDESDRIE
jgi:hypothetical protein